MSIPPQYAHRSGSEPVEDCRDYLRTGRCKYGASCKYNHPPNVESGGGMRAPLDPNEPMFPVRPNEPLCQYYMKHGTCKFAQACKFHHPPQASVQGLAGGGTVLMNTGGRKVDAAQLVLNPVATDSNGQPMMVQFLPQRPDEADCIYFLKNGRCKYGATCRYHHPIDYHQRRGAAAARQRRPVQMQDSYSTQKVQYVTQAMPSSGYAQNRVVVSDSPVTFLTVEGSNVPQGYQPVSVITGSDGVSTTYCAPVGTAMVPDQSSSASSIASSYDTANTNADQLQAQSETTAALWNRARRNNSGGSLSAYSVDRVQARAIPHSTSDGSIDLRRNRASSYGSGSDQSAYYDANPSYGPQWRGDRPSYDHVHRVPVNQYSGRPDGISSGGSGEFAHLERSPQTRRRPPVTASQLHRDRRRSSRSGESDEGFTMMTSALLNMLDTPEEALAENAREEDALRFQPSPYHLPSQQIDPSLLEGLSLHSRTSDPSLQDSNLSNSKEAASPSWSPSWVGSSAGPPMQENAQAMHTMQPRHEPGPAPNSPPSSSDVGLYLP